MLISVIVPAFNCQQYLSEAIASVQAQDLHDIEIIIIDDGSSDQTLALARRLACDDSRIVVHAQRNSGGPADPRNRAIALSSGEVIAFLDPDDYWYPHKMAMQLRVLDEYPEVDLVFDDADLVAADGESLDNTYLGRAAYLKQSLPHLRPIGSDIYLARESFFAFTAIGPVGPLTSGVLVRRSALARQAEWFPPDLPVSEDNDLWYRLISDGTAAFVNLPLHAYRQRAESLTRDRRRLLAGQALAHARNFFRSSPRLTPDERRHYSRRIGGLYASLAYHLRRSQEPKAARAAYCTSLRWYGTPATVLAYLKTFLPNVR